MEEAPAGWTGSALPVGGWGLCQGGSGKGAGCPSDDRRRARGRAESNPGGGAGIPGIDRELGIWDALANVYPDAAEQRCWNHKIVNVLDKLPKKAQPQAKPRSQDIAYAESRPETEEKRDDFLDWCRKEGCRAARGTRCSATGREWSPSTNSRRSTGSTWDDQRGRIAFCRPPAQDGCRQAVQEGGKRHRDDLKNAQAGGVQISSSTERVLAAANYFYTF